MPKAGFIPQKFKIWIEMRQKLRLSHKHIQMAKELGLNPKKLPRLANTQGSPWKAALPEFLEHLYTKRFNREEPEQILKIEEMAKREMEARAMRKAKKVQNPNPE